MSFLLVLRATIVLLPIVVKALPRPSSDECWQGYTACCSELCSILNNSCDKVPQCEDIRIKCEGGNASVQPVTPIESPPPPPVVVVETTTLSPSTPNAPLESTSIQTTDNSPPIFDTSLSPSSSPSGPFQFATDPTRLYNFCPRTLPAGAEAFLVGGENICLGNKGVGSLRGGQCVYTTAENPGVVSETPICVGANRPGLHWVDAAQVVPVKVSPYVLMYVPDPTIWVCQGEINGKMVPGNLPVHAPKTCYTPDGPTDAGVKVLAFESVGSDADFESLKPYDPHSTFAHDMSEGLYVLTQSAGECRQFCETLPGCGFFYWYFEGNCWLKSADIIPKLIESTPDPSDTARGGIVNKTPDQLTPKINGCSVISDITRGGIMQGHVIGATDTILQHFDMSMDSCCQLCRSTQGCLSISYLQYEHNCFLHTTNDAANIIYVPTPSVPGDSFVAKLD